MKNTSHLAMTSIRGDSGRRDELSRLHDAAWRRIAEPGTWLAGAERCAIVSEVRRADECALCAERKAALSPFAVDGTHDSGGVLRGELVDVVHRVATDPGRLSKKWYDAVIDAGVADTHYVEAVGITVRVVCIDSYCRAIGDPLRPPPEPVAGEPSRERPNAEPGVAWVPMVELPSLPNVGRALSLAPTENAAMQKLVQAQYVPVDKVRDFRFEPGRSLSRPQIELVAARVSALNECFY